MYSHHFKWSLTSADKINYLAFVGGIQIERAEKAK